MAGLGVVERGAQPSGGGALLHGPVTAVASGAAASTVGAGRWVVVLVVAPDVRAAERVTHDVLPKAHVQVVTRAAVPHLVVRLPLPEADQWAALRKSLGALTSSAGWSVLTVFPRSEADDVERRRARAQAMLPVVAALPVPRRLLDMDELLAFEVLAAVEPEEQEAIVRRVLGPVLDQPGGAGRRHVATLEALHWHDGSVKAAAKALGVHTKTVHNRLRRIEALTGLWLDHPGDRLRMDLALYLLRLRSTKAFTS